MQDVSNKYPVNWEFVLQRVINQKRGIGSVEEKRAKFEKLKKQMVEFVEHMRPQVLNRFFEGHKKCRLSRRGTFIKIKRCVIPAFKAFAKEAWNLDCHVLHNGFLKLCSSNKLREMIPYEETSEKFQSMFKALFEKLNTFRKQKSSTDFSFVCTSESGEEVRCFFAHKAVLLSPKLQIDSMSITIKAPGDLHAIESVIKWLYFQPVKRFESFQEMDQFNQLIQPFGSEKQRFELLAIDYYISRLQRALKNDREEECDFLLAESKEFAEKHQYQLLASFSQWSAATSLWKLKFVKLHEGDWTQALRKVIDAEDSELHECVKTAKYQKALQRHIQFAEAHLPKLIKNFSHGKTCVAFPMEGKRMYTEIFIQLVQEKWNVRCEYDIEFNEFCLTSNEERVPYPLYQTDEDARLDHFGKVMRYVRLTHEPWFGEEKLQDASMPVKMIHGCLYKAAIDRQEAVIDERLKEMAELAEQYAIPMLNQIVDWWQTKSHFWKSFKVTSYAPVFEIF